MVDFTKSNRWKTFNDQMKTPTEKKIVEYFELLERQIIALEAQVHKLELAMKAETEESHG